MQYSMQQTERSDLRNILEMTSYVFTVFSFMFSPLSCPQIVRTFSFKGMTNKLFGQEAPEQREARLKLLEELITEGEETVKEKTVECE